MGGSDVRWGLMATGQIAALMAESAAGRFVAVASRSADKARTFADKHGIERSYANYQALLDDPVIDAVYIALPVTQHSEWTVRRCGRASTCCARSRWLSVTLKWQPTSMRRQRPTGCAWKR